MDENLHVNKQMDEAESLHSRTEEDGLPKMIMETTQSTEADRGSTGQHMQAAGGPWYAGEIQGGSEERMLSPAETEEGDERRGASADGEQVERECKQKVLGVLKEMGVFHSEKVSAWREALRECVSMFNNCPPGGSDQQYASATGMEDDFFYRSWTN